MGIKIANAEKEQEEFEAWWLTQEDKVNTYPSRIADMAKNAALLGWMGRVNFERQLAKEGGDAT